MAYILSQELEKKKEVSRRSSRLRRNIVQARDFEKAQEQYREVVYHIKLSIKCIQMLIPEMKGIGELYCGYCNMYIIVKTVELSLEVNRFS